MRKILLVAAALILAFPFGATADEQAAAKLKALIAGSTLFLPSRSTGWSAYDGYDIQLMFSVSGGVKGTASQTTGSAEDRSISGKWWFKGDKLCTKLDADANRTACYAISRRGNTYGASGANGILDGNFMLSK